MHLLSSIGAVSFFSLKNALKAKSLHLGVCKKIYSCFAINALIELIDYWFYAAHEKVVSTEKLI